LIFAVLLLIRDCRADNGLFVLKLIRICIGNYFRYRFKKFLIKKLWVDAKSEQKSVKNEQKIGKTEQKQKLST
jgi:hypothetical protein